MMPDQMKELAARLRTHAAMLGSLIDFLPSKKDARIRIADLDAAADLIGQMAQLAADARRYRWLRDFSSGETDDYGNVSIEFHCNFENYANPDASIDAAMGVK